MYDAQLYLVTGVYITSVLTVRKHQNNEAIDHIIYSIYNTHVTFHPHTLGHHHSMRMSERKGAQSILFFGVIVVVRNNLKHSNAGKNSCALK